MFNPGIYENSRPDGFALLEVVARQDDLREQDVQQKTPTAPRFVPLQHTLLRGTVVGPLADLTLTQVFGYARTTYAHPIEALYRFPLPGDAAVQAVVVRFGEVEIRAELQERSAAEEHYAAAKAAGHQAALATREAPDVFTLQLAGIQPDQPVTVETHYVQLARAEQEAYDAAGTQHPQWSLRIPLTTAPRFVRADEKEGRWVHGQPLALLRDPGHRFQLDLNFAGVATVSSPTHELTIAQTDDVDRAVLQVRLAAGEVLPDRDCLLRWSPPQAADNPTIELHTYVDNVDNAEGATPYLYFLALVTPPVKNTSPKGVESDPIAREATLLVDHSGSMRGAKWSAADWAIERFLADLTAADAFALAIFHNKTRWFVEAIQPAHSEATTAATAWLQQQQESGGTELGVALEQALHLQRWQPPATATLTRHLLIVTDAAVSDAARILRLADAEAARPDRRRISVLCIDAAPNAFLANELAARGGGVSRFLTSDPAQADIVTALDDLLLEWSRPLLADLQLHVNRADVMVGGQHSVIKQGTGEESVIDLGDLAAGRAQWVVGRLPMVASDGDVDRPLQLALSAAFGDERRVVAEAACSAQRQTHRGTAALKALFGVARVNALEFLMHANFDQAQLAVQLRRLGYDPASLFAAPAPSTTTIYAENIQKESVAALRGLLVNEALTYGLASAETAFVAVRQEAGEPAQEQVVVANALPAGWSGDFAAGNLPPSMVRRAAAGMRASSFASAAPQCRDLGSQMRQMIAPAFLPAPSPAGLTAGTGDPTNVRGNTAGDNAAQTYTVFDGQPQFDGAVAVLFDSTSQVASSTEPSSSISLLPAELIVSGITLTFAANQPAVQPERSVTIAIFIDDLITPRATIRLADLLRHGTRPLNLHRSADAPLRLTLHDPTHSLQKMGVAFSVILMSN